MEVPEAEMPYLAGYEETGFLNNLHVTIDDIEFLADNCTKIYVWHTRTQKSKAASREILDNKYDGTNLRHLQAAMAVQ
ncbi:Galactosylgalactosylxylosylprotein 3-beta-glucuronosyltransferase P [Portunus trituberculatus]|uniref:Galactosylgalactosylxylosylprotein 3-beta-glucuronosyltransferase n=1 Tax=Portunus trituberculatus TaxID=210409 RepID=A0A5B7GH10_PORTR|nr:Galactosylgalactosylxylosylprotein 3-beta-glucuronosyltransferase P [Portunus trituberculatus]